MLCLHCSFLFKPYGPLFYPTYFLLGLYAGAAGLNSPQLAEVGAGEQPQQQAESSAAGSEQQQAGSDREADDDAGWRQIGSRKMAEDDAGWQQVGSGKGGRGGQQAARASNAPPRSPVTQRPPPTVSPAKAKPKGRARVVWCVASNSEEFKFLVGRGFVGGDIFASVSGRLQIAA